MRPTCTACAFYREIALKHGSTRRLCMFTGEKRPARSMNGCHFLPGQWSQIDVVLGLPTDYDCGNLDVPNQVKQVAAFSRNGINVTDIHSLDDFRINADCHISEKLEGSLVRPGIREDQVAHLARERTRLPFHV